MSRALAACIVVSLAYPFFARAASDSSSGNTTGLNLGDRLRINGEAGAGFFDTGSRGSFPNSEFRIDEARLFLDAKIEENVFLFTELNLAQRETQNDSVEVGELYVDIEDVQRVWDGVAPLTLRVGRVDIPFGEEYLTRDAIDNAFVSHTLADIWGVDEGVEAFGKLGIFDYTFAVQNGGYKKWRDGDPDKALVARIGVGPAKGLRFSASAMRTGNLDVKKDELSEVWFGNAYISPVGAPQTTRKFHAEIGQLDARYRWAGGSAAASLGAIRYDDDDTAADNKRDANYWSAEVLQDIARGWYAGLRYSQIRSGDGFTAPGQGDFQAVPAYGVVENIWRASAVIGLRFSERLLWKTEYSMERGRWYESSSIRQQDMVATEIACSF